MNTSPELSIDVLVEHVNVPASVDLADLLLDQYEADGGGNDAVRALADRLIFSADVDTTSALVADADAYDDDLAAALKVLHLGEHFLAAYSTGDVARFLLDVFGPAGDGVITDDDLLRALAWTVENDPHPASDARHAWQSADVTWSALSAMHPADWTRHPMLEEVEEHLVVPPHHGISVMLPEVAYEVAVTYEHGKHLRDRSAGRWCETCGHHTDHHTDRHDQAAITVEDQRSTSLRLASRLLFSQYRALLTVDLRGVAADTLWALDPSALTFVTDLDADEESLVRAALNLEYVMTGPDTPAAAGVLDEAVERIAHLVTDMPAEDEDSEEDDEHVLRRADEVAVGMLLNLEGDRYADPDGDGVDDDGHFAAFEFEYAHVDSIEREGTATVVLHTTLGSVAFPASHLLKVEPSSIPTAPAQPTSVTVDLTVPAAWVGLLRFGVFEQAHGALRDELGRPVVKGNVVPSVAVDDPAPYREDRRTVVGTTDDLEVLLDLGSGATNYYVSVSVETADGDLLVEHGDYLGHSLEDVTHTPLRLDDGREVALNVTLEWPTPNQRATAIDTVKRLYGVSRTVAASVVDTGRFRQLAEAEGTLPAAETVVGCVAVGHLDTETVVAFMAQHNDVTDHGQFDGDGWFRLTCGERELLVDHAQSDWGTVELDGQDVATGLPANGGPNPRSAAKKLLRLLVP